MRFFLYNFVQCRHIFRICATQPKYNGFAIFRSFLANCERAPIVKHICFLFKKGVFCWQRSHEYCLNCLLRPPQKMRKSQFFLIFFIIINNVIMLSSFYIIQINQIVIWNKAGSMQLWLTLKRQAWRHEITNWRQASLHCIRIHKITLLLSILRLSLARSTFIIWNS